MIISAASKCYITRQAISFARKWQWHVALRDNQCVHHRTFALAGGDRYLCIVSRNEQAGELIIEIIVDAEEGNDIS